MRRVFALLLAVAAVLVAAPPSNADGAKQAVQPPVRDTPPAPVPDETMPELVWVPEIVGTPPDSLLNAAFWRGFRMAFDAGMLRTERPAGDSGWVFGLPIENRFRQLFGNSGEGAWRLDVALTGVVPDEPRGRGTLAMDVTFAVHTPQMIASNARPIPSRVRLTAARTPGSPVEYLRGLGAAVAALALERLHHLHGALDPRDRLPLGPFLRSTPPPTIPPAR